MEEVQDLRPSHSGEEILVAPGKADNLVGEDGADDQEFIVIEEARVDIHGNLHREATAGEFADLVGLERADAAECCGVVPLVVEETHSGIPCRPFLCRDPEPYADRLFIHGRVRAQRDHDVEGGYLAGQLSVEFHEYHPERATAGGIGHDE